MLEYRYVPLRELFEMKHTHHIVMEAMAAHGKLQPGDDQVWPGLRTLSKITKYAINTVRKAISEMETLGYLTVIRGPKGSVNRYLIEARFLRAAGARPTPVAVGASTTPPVTAAPTLHRDDPQPEIDERQISFDFCCQAAEVYQPLTQGVSTADTEGKAKESQVSFKKEEAIPFGRDAPLEEPPEPTIVKFAEIPGLKAKKKEMRRQKVTRFINASYTGEQHRVRIEGMFGCDPTRDEQWWFDKCDAEMILAKWDDKTGNDVRGKHRGTWQRMA